MMQPAPIGWLNTVLPLLVLVGLAVLLPEVTVPRGTLSHRALALGVAVSGLLIVFAGALVLALAYDLRGAGVVAALRVDAIGTAWFFVVRSLKAGLVWGPILALVWLTKAQAVEARRGDAKAAEGRQ